MQTCMMGRQDSPHQRLRCAIKELLEENGYSEDDVRQLLDQVPRGWERHGDLVLFRRAAFYDPRWDRVRSRLWSVCCEKLQCQRLAIGGSIAGDGHRTPRVELVIGDHGWVTHVDNKIKYTFDVTQCMFSAGNVTEKLRVASLPCRGQTVVDLYAGIGYFTLPYLVHAGASHVHACEWNPAAVEALRKNLQLNGVADRCTVHVGDCRQACPERVADRVNLGLIPSSAEGWPTACRALNPDRECCWMHVHENVECKPGTTETKRELWQDRARQVCAAMEDLLRHHGRGWTVTCEHIERVKSYAPRVDHLVLDLRCQQLSGGVCGSKTGVTAVSETH